MTISFPQEGIGTAAEGIALIKGAKNPALGKKLIDWATSPPMQGLFAKYKINFVPAHPDVALEPGLAAVLKGAKIFAIDADYGPAYAGLGEAYWRGFDEFNRGDDWVQKATESCQKALAESSGLAEAHSCLGYVYNSTGQYSKAVDEFQYALALDRYSADSLKGLANSYEKQGNLSGAETAYREAIALVTKIDHHADRASIATEYARKLRARGETEKAYDMLELARGGMRKS